MYLIDKDTSITTQYISKVINQFEFKDKPKLQKYYNYYEGNQEILRKVARDDGRPCNKVVTNYCQNIANTFQGYITGLPISYTSDKSIDGIFDILNYNDVKNEDTELLKDALIFGVGYEILWIDGDGQQRFKRLDPREIIPIYGNTLDEELLYVIRYYTEETIDQNSESYIVEVYSNDSIKRYRSNLGFSSFNLLEEIPHFYNQVPITVFNLNRDNKACFDSVMTLQDAYNNLLSSEIDDFDTFADAYLIMKGVVADADDLVEAKQKRAFCVDSDCEISYLTKNISDTQIENMLTNINDQIHKMSNCPDFNDEKLMAQSGIAMKYKLIGFNNVSSSIIANMTKALQKRIELICEIINLTGDTALWRDINIIFTTNLPENTLETAQMVNQLRGLVSDETLLSQISFIPNAQDEVKKIQAQKQANIEMYGFTSNGQDDEE